MQDHLGHYKAWNTSFSPGTTLYKDKEPFIVLSAGTDFLFLQSETSGEKVKLSRNTQESYEYTATPRRD